MTSTRILTRRRLGVAPHIGAGTPDRKAPSRRRRRARSFVQTAGVVAADKLRLNAFGNAYLIAGVILFCVLSYLALSAQITQASYDIARLQDQQSQLLSQQDQLRYQEISLHAPARVQAEAAASGLQRGTPVVYVTAPDLSIDLSAPDGAGPTDVTPLWERAVAGIISRVGGAKDAMAAGH